MALDGFRLNEHLLHELRNRFPEVPDNILLNHMKQNYNNRDRCMDTLQQVSPRYQDNLYGSTPNMYAVSTTTTPPHNHLHIAATGSLKDLRLEGQGDSTRHRHGSGGRAEGAMNPAATQHPVFSHSTSSPAKTHAGTHQQPPNEDYREPSTAPVASFQPFVGVDTSRIQGIPCSTGSTNKVGNGTLAPTTGGSPKQPGHHPLPSTENSSQYIHTEQLQPLQIPSAGRSPPGPQHQPPQASSRPAVCTPPPPEASGYHFHLQAWGGALSTGPSEGAASDSNLPRPVHFDQPLQVSTGVAGNISYPPGTHSPHQPPVPRTDVGASYHSPLSHNRGGYATTPPQGNPGNIGQAQPAGNYMSKVYIKMNSGGEVLTPPPMNPPGSYFPQAGGASGVSGGHLQYPAPVYVHQKSSDSGGSVSSPSAGTPTHHYPACPPHVPYQQPGAAYPQAPMSYNWQPSPPQPQPPAHTRPQPPQNLLTSSDAAELARITQEPIQPTTPGSDRGSNTPSVPGSSQGAAGTPDSEGAKSSRSGSVTGEDVAYTQALIMYQQARMSKLTHDLDEGHRLLATLRSQVMEMERSFLERRKARNLAVSADDVQKMREENRQMQINIQILAHEIDMINNGQTKLGVLEPPEEQNFYKNIPAGQRGSLYSSSGGPPGSLEQLSPAATTAAIIGGNATSATTVVTGPPPPPATHHNYLSSPSSAGAATPPSSATSSSTPKRRTPPPRPPPPSQPCQPPPPQVLPSSHPPPPPYHTDYRSPPPPVPLPATAGEPGAVGGREEEQEGENWNCSACTFLNHPLLNKCECCEMPRVFVGDR